MNDYLVPQQHQFPQTLTVDPTTGTLVPVGHTVPGVYTITAPDGTVRHVYGPGAGAAPVLVQNTALPLAETNATRPAVHPWLANLLVGALALGAVAFALHLLIGFMAALAHLVMTLAVLVAVLVGAFLALQLLTGSSRGTGRTGTTVNIKKAVFKRNTFRG